MTIWLVMLGDSSWTGNQVIRPFEDESKAKDLAETLQDNRPTSLAGHDYFVTGPWEVAA